jgi:glycosyltransferase involved in cell wall biosynthesis
MKILHLDTRPDWRGGQHQVLMTLRGQRQRGHDAQLMALDGSPMEQRAAASKFAVHTFPAHLARLNALRCLREITAKQRFDVVHAHDPHALSAAWLSRANHRSALVVSRRVAYPLSRGWPALARYRAAHRIIAVSRFVADSVIAGGIDASYVSVVYDGVEIPPATSREARSAAQQQWDIDDATLLLGCVGYLLPEKGQELLLRAMKTVVSEFPKCKLILAGDGPMRAQLESLASELAIRNTIVFAGFVEDTAAIYRALDVFAFPSLAEPLGSSLLAAMAHGLPSIAVASGGVPEVIEDRRNGMLIQSADANQLAVAICNLLRDLQLARGLGNAARDTVERRFSVDLLAENTLREYETALRRFRAS